MNILNFGGFEEGDATGARSITGGTSFSTSINAVGAYSYRCSPGTSGTDNIRLGIPNATTGVPTAEINVATLWSRFKIYLGTRPGSGSEQIFSVVDTSGAVKAHGRWKSTGEIELYDNTGTLRYTSTYQCPTNAFTIFRWKTSTGAGSQPCELEIYNDAGSLQEASGALSFAQGTVNHGSLRLGKAVNQSSQSYTAYYDDWCFCDDEYPDVLGGTKAIVPTGNGGTASWTGGTNSSNHAEVDEIPLNDADYIAKTASGSQTHLFEMQDCATVGITGTVRAVKVHGRLREGTSGTSAFRVIMKSNATTVGHTGNNGSTTVTNHEYIRNTDPDGNVAWTTSAVDALEMGVDDTGSVTNSRCTQLIGMVEFTSGASVSIAGTADATSDVQGDLTKTRTVAATADGTSAVDAVAQVARSVVSSAAATSNATGASSVSRAIVSTATAVSDSAGVISRAVPITGAATSTSAATAVATVTQNLAGVVASTSSVTAIATVSRSLVASANGTSSTASIGTGEKLLAGVVGALTDAAGDVTKAAAMVASVSAVSSVSGNLTSEGQLTAAGLASASSTVTGTATVSRSLSALVASISGAAAAPSRSIPVAGDVSGSSTASADLAQAIGLQAVVAASSNTAALASRASSIAALVAGASNSQASITRAFGVSALVTAIADATAQPRRAVPLSASQIDAASDIVASATLVLGLKGVVNGIASAAAQASAEWAAQASVEVESDVNASLSILTFELGKPRYVFRPAHREYVTRAGGRRFII